MKLFLISQDENQDYDTYDSAVVAAPNGEIASQMNPANGKDMVWGEQFSSWCSGPGHVVTRYLGEAVEGIEQGVVCASFNAG